MGIGSVLQELLDKNHTNVNAVSVATGVNASTLYSMIKRDNLKASITDLNLVAQHLGVDLDYICSRIDPSDAMDSLEKRERSVSLLVTNEESEIIAKFRSADGHTKKIVKTVLSIES